MKKLTDIDIAQGDALVNSILDLRATILYFAERYRFDPFYNDMNREYLTQIEEIMKRLDND